MAKVKPTFRPQPLPKNIFDTSGLIKVNEFKSLDELADYLQSNTFKQHMLEKSESQLRQAPPHQKSKPRKDENEDETSNEFTSDALGTPLHIYAEGMVGMKRRQAIEALTQTIYKNPEILQLFVNRMEDKTISEAQVKKVAEFLDNKYRPVMRTFIRDMVSKHVDACQQRMGAFAKWNSKEKECQCIGKDMTYTPQYGCIKE